MWFGTGASMQTCAMHDAYLHVLLLVLFHILSALGTGVRTEPKPDM
jgi:hypothetical protein